MAKAVVKEKAKRKSYSLKDAVDEADKKGRRRSIARGRRLAQQSQKGPARKKPKYGSAKELGKKSGIKKEPQFGKVKPPGSKKPVERKSKNPTGTVWDKRPAEKKAKDSTKTVWDKQPKQKIGEKLKARSPSKGKLDTDRQKNVASRKAAKQASSKLKIKPGVVPQGSSRPSKSPNKRFKRAKKK